MSLKRPCKIQFRCVGGRSIGPVKSYDQISFLARSPHCNYNVKFKVVAGADLWVYNAKNLCVSFFNQNASIVHLRGEKNGLPNVHTKRVCASSVCSVSCVSNSGSQGMIANVFQSIYRVVFLTVPPKFQC